MTWRDPESGEKRLNRGTSGSGSVTARSARSAPTTMVTARTPRETCSASTMRGAATRPLTIGTPPITRHKGHAAGGRCSRRSARSTRSCASRPPLRRQGDRPPRRRVGGGARVSAGAYNRCGELGFLGLKYETEYGGQGGDYVHDAVWVEELSHSGGVRRGRGRPRRTRRRSRLPPIWKFGTQEQKQRWLVPGIRGEQIGALGITEPGAGSDVAGCGPARRSTAATSSTARRSSSPTASARTRSSAPPRRPRRAATTASLPRAGAESPATRASPSWRRWAGTRPTPVRSATATSRCPRRTCSASENQGFYMIMANFQWERLIDGAGRDGRDEERLRGRRSTTRRSARRSGGRSAASR